jgi:guanylate kinase
MARGGNLFIVSGPSGAGKSVLAASVLGMLPSLHFSISYTTRSPRGSERDGVEYHFVDRQRFRELEEAGEFLEWAEVYGNYYGTSRRFIDEMLTRGEDVLLDIDVQGARTIREKRRQAITIFIMPPSFEVLRSRLERRKLDKDYVMKQRLDIARSEIEHYANYDFLIINEEIGRSVDELKGIILARRCQMPARAEVAQAIVATFGGMDAKSP